MEIFIAVVDDGIVLAAGSDVANTLVKEKNDNSVTAKDFFYYYYFCSKEI